MFCRLLGVFRVFLLTEEHTKDSESSDVMFHSPESFILLSASERFVKSFKHRKN